MNYLTILPIYTIGIFSDYSRPKSASDGIRATSDELKMLNEPNLVLPALSEVEGSNVEGNNELCSNEPNFCKTNPICAIFRPKTKITKKNELNFACLTMACIKAAHVSKRIKKEPYSVSCQPIFPSDEIRVTTNEQNPNEPNFAQPTSSIRNPDSRIEKKCQTNPISAQINVSSVMTKYYINEQRTMNNELFINEQRTMNNELLSNEPNLCHFRPKTMITKKNEPNFACLTMACIKAAHVSKRIKKEPCSVCCQPIFPSDEYRATNSEQLTMNIVQTNPIFNHGE